MKYELNWSVAERECCGWKVVDLFKCEMAESGDLDKGHDSRFFSSWEFIPVAVRYLHGGQGGRVTYSLQ